MLGMLPVHIVTLYKKDGIVCEGIKAHVQPKMVFIDVKDNVDCPPIESGDIIEHKQSNGVTEQYEVLDPCYYDEIGSLGKHYQCEVRKLSAVEKKQAQTVFNINANQANIATNNATINAFQNNNVDIAQVEKLIEAVRRAIPHDILQDDKNTITENLEVVEEQLARPIPKKSVMTTLLTGIKAIAGTVEFGAAVTALIQFIQTTF